MKWSHSFPGWGGGEACEPEEFAQILCDIFPESYKLERIDDGNSTPYWAVRPIGPGPSTGDGAEVEWERRFREMAAEEDSGALIWIDFVAHIESALEREEEEEEED